MIFTKANNSPVAQQRPLNPLASEFQPSPQFRRHNVASVSPQNSFSSQSNNFSSDQSFGRTETVSSSGELSQSYFRERDSTVDSSPDITAVVDNVMSDPEVNIPLRRSSRQARPPVRFQDYIRF